MLNLDGLCYVVHDSMEYAMSVVHVIRERDVSGLLCRSYAT